ncbi:MAG: DUF4136 domain-containing protein [Pyrinomonadaceae bacterium]
MKFRPALLCFLLAVVSVAARAQEVAVDFARNSDFSKFKTFSWAQGTPARNPLIDQQIKTGIEQRLAAKGLRRVEQGGDMSVMYLAAVEKDLQVATANWVTTGDWTRQAAHGIHVESQMWDVEVGTLVVCLFDATGKDLLWRGSARVKLHDRSSSKDILSAMNEDARKAEKKVSKSLDKMFKQYPATRPAG